jgi:beta-galactosidase
MATQTRHDWRAAEMVDSYGLTWVACRKGDEPWKLWHGVDLTRAAARGKEFWHAEAQGGPLWLQPQVVGRPREDGRIPEPEDLRLWHLTSFAAGARGLLYPRWRPLLDGPLFGAFGPYGMDGGRTDRSRMTSRLATWANAPDQVSLWQSSPVQGEVGIVVVPETQLFTYGLMGSTDAYGRAMEGAYQGFFDANIQADWVLVDDLATGDANGYSLLYLPFPVMLAHATADLLMDWVRGGGTLVSEGCPAYFGDRGHVSETQPNLGLDELFGAREAYVEFTPDLLEDLRVNVDGLETWGGAFLQVYTPISGTPVGWYEDGRVAAVDHRFGEGRVRLIGTMCGYGYDGHPDARDPAFYEAILHWAGGVRHVTCSDPRVRARLHDGAGGTYLWVVNPAREDLLVRLTLSDTWGPFAATRAHWGPTVAVDGQVVTVTVPARDAAVVRLVV